MLRSSSARAAVASLALGLGIPLGLGGCNLIFGIEAVGDPPPADAAGAAGSAGAASGAAGSPGAGQAGGSGAAGSPDEVTTPVPSPTGLLGHVCPSPGQRACDRRADKMVVLCDGDPPIWGPLELCDGAQLCDGRLESEVGGLYASCQPIVDVCLGQRPGDVVCEGNLRHVCGPDLVTTATEACASAQHCLLGNDAGCALCLPGEHACDGATLKECSDDRRSFVETTQCSTAELCNAVAGACTADACTDGQARCNGNNLEVCNAGRTGFDLLQACGGGICDAVGKQCDVCTPGAATCANGSTRGVCAPDGQSFANTACGAASPYCVGQGQCVACIADNQCPDPTPICQIGICSGNQCATTAAPDGTGCGAGRVCESGTCVCPYKGSEISLCQPCVLVRQPDGTQICQPV
jgi:hypothetical protein